jgi:hypothetical protein
MYIPHICISPPTTFETFLILSMIFNILYILSLQLLSSSLLSKNLKIKIYIIIILPVVLYGRLY